MVRHSLFLGCLIFLAACAEVVPLTGGPSDQRAAVPVEGTQNPEQGALHVNQNELTVRFDEYFTLNDPANTAVMNPDAGKLEVTSNKRDLSIKWDGTLQPNTTYIIQLNGTIKDLNEKNDTIHQFVFSTGSQIDSLKVLGLITDGFSNKPGNSFTVGLYKPDADPFKNPPSYICKSDARGTFEFSYLKPGDYQLFAFLDSNKDRLPTIGEDIAYTSGLVSSSDTVLFHLLASKPKKSLDQLQIKVSDPGVAFIYGKEINLSALQINQQPVEVIKRFSPDSLLLALPVLPVDGYTFTDEKDTVTKVIPVKDRNRNFTVSNKVYKNSWTLGDTLLFETNERIEQVDTSLIVVEDKTKLKTNYKYFVEGNQVRIIPQSAIDFDLNIHFRSGALKGKSNRNDSTKIELKTLHSSDLSSLKLNLESLKGQWIIQLMEGTTIVRSFHKSESDSAVLWEKLIPAVYQVRCIRDANGNGKWDYGHWEEKSQPEQVVRFDLKSKLRPNWDIEETLELSPNE